MAYPTEEQLAWMMANAHLTHVPAIIATSVLFGVLSTVFVGLRLYSRWLMRVGMQMNDWLMIVAYVFSLAVDINLICTTIYGNGHHVIFVTDFRMLAILTILNEIYYGLSLAFIKLSVLSLYMTLFPPTRFRYAIYASMALVIAWVTSLFWAAIFHCTPVEYNWDKTIDGHCIDGGIAASAWGIANVVTDFVVLAIPIPSVLKLKLTRKKKMLTLFTFVMGGSACLVSIIRLPYTINLGSSWNLTYDQMAATITTSLEVCVGILATSIPTYLPLIRRWTNALDKEPSSPVAPRHPGAEEVPTIGGGKWSGGRGSSSHKKSHRHGITITRTTDLEMSVHRDDEQYGRLGSSEYVSSQGDTLYKQSQNSSYDYR